MRAPTSLEVNIMQTSRFGVRPSVRLNGGPGSPGNGVRAPFEVFDRVTGAAVASGMPRVEAEREARRRNDDTSESTPMTLRLGPREVSALREAIDVYLAFEVAGGATTPILEDLYVLFASWGRGTTG